METKILYNGQTGEMMEAEIFMGPTFYQRLKHMVIDKQAFSGARSNCLADSPAVRGQVARWRICAWERWSVIVCSHTARRRSQRSV
jgi:hypothetical protein